MTGSLKTGWLRWSSFCRRKDFRILVVEDIVAILWMGIKNSEIRFVPAGVMFTIIELLTCADDGILWRLRSGEQRYSYHVALRPAQELFATFCSVVCHAKHLAIFRRRLSAFRPWNYMVSFHFVKLKRFAARGAYAFLASINCLLGFLIKYAKI